jgi:hypothetical protein
VEIDDAALVVLEVNTRVEKILPEHFRGPLPPRVRPEGLIWVAVGQVVGKALGDLV